MSEDEDEELAMLRLQALMSKRRAGGAGGASKDLKIPFPASLMTFVSPVQPTSSVASSTTSSAAAAAAVPLSTIAVVTASSSVAVMASVVTDRPAQSADHNAGATYQQPHFRHGQLPVSYHVRCVRKKTDLQFSLNNFNQLECIFGTHYSVHTFLLTTCKICKIVSIAC